MFKWHLSAFKMIKIFLCIRFCILTLHKAKVFYFKHSLLSIPIAIDV